VPMKASYWSKVIPCAKRSGETTKGMAGLLSHADAPAYARARGSVTNGPSDFQLSELDALGRQRDRHLGARRATNLNRGRSGTPANCCGLRPWRSRLAASLRRSNHLDSQRVRLVGGKLSPQLTAFFTSAPILASAAVVNSFSAKDVGAFVEVRLVAEAERRVPRVELLRALEEADDIAVLGIRGHPVPGSRREGWRAGFDDGMEPLSHGAIRSRHLGDLREHVAFPVRLARACAAARGHLQLLGALLYRGSFLVRESLGRLAGGSPRGLLRGLRARFPLSHSVVDLLRAALSRGPDVTDRSPASYFSGSPCASFAIALNYKTDKILA